MHGQYLKRLIIYTILLSAGYIAQASQVLQDIAALTQSPSVENLVELYNYIQQNPDLSLIGEETMRLMIDALQIWSEQSAELTPPERAAAQDMITQIAQWLTVKTALSA